MRRQIDDIEKITVNSASRKELLTHRVLNKPGSSNKALNRTAIIRHDIFFGLIAVD